MQLRNFIPDIDKNYFSRICINSSNVKKNDIFFAIKGNKYDGNKFINIALKKGAKIIISEKKKKIKKEGIIFVKTSKIRKLLAETCYSFLKKKPKNLVAVTGTNGKSSIADFYYQILNLNSKKVASIGTLGVRYKNKKKKLNNTTLDPINLCKTLVNLRHEKINHIIMEASSHGLQQNRLDGLMFDTSIFSNLSHDHLDYHKNMRNYLKTKLYLFEKLTKKKGHIITDASIPQSKEIKKISNKKKINLNLIFDNKKGIELISHKFKDEKQILKIRFKNISYTFEFNLLGKIQIKNLLMAVLAAHKSGIKFEKIIDVIKKIKPVEGRLEKIGIIKNKSKVILDYAHTPDALELALLNLKQQFPNNKINLVFGCGGERDFKKRALMGRIAEKYSNRVYLTDDNPRNENPKKIRIEIKKGFRKIKVNEISNRKKAIFQAVSDLKTGELLLVAGKGHEKFQDYGKKKLFFSDKEIILRSIKSKNNNLSKNLKLNIINEEAKRNLSNQIFIKKISIDSRSIKKNDVFCAIKGKKVDGNIFVSEAFKKKSSLAIVNKFNNKHSLLKQVKVKNSLNFLTKCSSIFRQNINAKIISITGSCGKTTLKEMVGRTLKKISKTTFSPRSFNNKYGVPISLINLRQNDDFGVFEVGMDKKGEIDNLTKIIQPDLGVITNISYAHSKNFNNINKIAEAKAEIMNNIKKDGIIVLNSDDSFYKYHKKVAIKKKLKVISFGIKNKLSNIKLIKLKKMINKFELKIKVDDFKTSFYSTNVNTNNLYNILATIAVIHSYIDIRRFKKDIFLDFKTPNGRGDLSKVKLKDKEIFLVDEAYNSNPLSLKTAIENYDKLKSKNSKKYLILGDMLELGKHSLQQHKLISEIINKTKIDQVFVIGKFIKETYKGLKLNKKAQIISNKNDIINLINENLNNNDYLMIKGSNSTGLHKITKDLKVNTSNVI
jgi:murE/murF fusion protein